MYIYMVTGCEKMNINAPNWKKDIPPLMPTGIRKALVSMSDSEALYLREIRLQARGPIAVCGRKDGFLKSDGSVCESPLRAMRLEPGECTQIFEAMTGHGPYACIHEICQGYITIPGGYRVGLAGEVVCTGGKVTHMKTVSSLNIRIVRSVRGSADSLIPLIAPGKGMIKSTLIISAPGMGKTTMIRDIARQLSSGTPFQSGIRVAVIDERGEIGGCMLGIPSLDIGLRTDILDGCPKPAGILWAVRSLSPRAVVTDEIGTADDVEALLEARNAGVAVVASAHSSRIIDALKRPAMRRLMNESLFDLYVLLGDEKPGVIREILKREQIANVDEMDRDRPSLHLM